MQTTHTNKNTSLQFTVNKKQVSKNKTLKTSVLYNKIEASANSSLILYDDSTNFSFKSIDFDIHKNAFLNDKLVIKNYIKKLNNTEIVLQVTVSKKEKDQQNIICKVVFAYNLNKKSI